MGAYDRDYWKTPTNNQHSNKRNIKSNNKYTEESKTKKFDIIIEEYNKCVPFTKRYYKVSQVLCYILVLTVAIIISFFIYYLKFI